MRILQVHNQYQLSGGEDTVVHAEREILQSDGHDLDQLVVSNDSIVSMRDKTRVAIALSFSKAGYDLTRRAISSFAPDIVHVHNYFPILSPSVFYACRDSGTPVVHTLHNYRAVCAGAKFMRKGVPCESCINGTPYQGALHRCYRDSRSASLAVARMISTHRRRHTWLNAVDRFITPSKFSKSKFVDAGFPADKITVKPNFMLHEIPCRKNVERVGALFAGRISAEKGIGTLLKAWHGLGVPLRLAGDGPLTGAVSAAKNPRIKALGFLNDQELSNELSAASFLVFPSVWYETFGLTIIEAYAHETPVIASRLGVMQDIVIDGVTGLLFSPGDHNDLSEKVKWAAAHPNEMARMGENARAEYEKSYTARANLSQLISIYEEAMRYSREHS